MHAVNIVTEMNKAVVDAAIRKIVGVTARNIGETISRTIRRSGFKIVENKQQVFFLLLYFDSFKRNIKL